MQRHYAYYRLSKGYRLADYALRWDMVHKVAQKRLDILKFLAKHGLEATTEAFGVSRRTLFNWKAKLKSENGNPG